MLSIILNIIGLICIITSLVFIKKASKKEKDIYEEIILIHNNIKDYSIAIENIFASFDDLMESSLEKIASIEKYNVYDVSNWKTEKNMKSAKSERIILEESSMPNISNIPSKEPYKKVIELNKIGLPDDEIAKKLNMGIREVEIILKMGNN